MAHAWLIGQPGVEGCATIRSGSSWAPPGKLDVAIYWETPEEIRDSRCQRDACYIQIEDVPGYGLRVIELIKQHGRERP